MVQYFPKKRASSCRKSTPKNSKSRLLCSIEMTPVQELCRKHYITQSTLYRWLRKQYRYSVPWQKRLEIMAGLYSKFDQYSVRVLCKAMEIAKGTFSATFSENPTMPVICRSSRNSGCFSSRFLMTARRCTVWIKYGSPWRETASR